MPEAAETAVEAKEKDRTVALLIAILALLLALSEAGAKRAQHFSTEKNIEASDLFNFYQAKRVRSSIAETAAAALEAQKVAAPPMAQEAFDRQIGAFKAAVARYEKDPKKPEDSLDALQERASALLEAREFANRRLENYEFSSGALQIAIVLASAAIITGANALLWMSVGLGVIGAVLAALGLLAPVALPMMG